MEALKRIQIICLKDAVSAGQMMADFKNIYEIIQEVMSPARGETCKVRTQILNDEDFTWLSQWKHTTFEGWRRAGKVAQIDDNETTGDEDSKDEVWANALKLRPNGLGDNIQWINMKAEPKETKAQGRYTVLHLQLALLLLLFQH